MVLLNSQGGTTNEKEFDAINQMFEEIIKLIQEKHIRLEAILSHMVEREMITQDSFDRIYNLLSDFGRKKGWVK